MSVFHVNLVHLVPSVSSCASSGKEPLGYVVRVFGADWMPFLSPNQPISLLAYTA